MKKIALVMSCEHAVDHIPKEYETLFEPFKNLLKTHRAIDFGALEIAQYLKEHLNCDYVQAKTSRLLVDCNRSASHPQCFSEVVEGLNVDEKQSILEQYYLPYRKQLIDCIEQKIQQGFQVIHLSIHSFTPELHGEVRKTDIGLLYDPKRNLEKQFAKSWQKALKQRAPTIRVRRNYPYQGTSDGFTTALRKLFQEEDYLGIEVESNQAFALKPESLMMIKTVLLQSLLSVLIV